MRLIDADKLKEELSYKSPAPDFDIDGVILGVIDEQPTVAASPWHRVEDGHPEGMRRCVIFDGYTMTTAYWIGGFRNEKRYWRKVDIGGKSRGMFPDSKVKMWMYVPEPPKEDA